MHTELLGILRCPYCGGRLELVDSLFHNLSGDTILDGIIGCQCCVFPVVDGIPVLHLGSAAVKARELVEAGTPALALRAMIGVDDEERAQRFEAAAARPTSTFKELVEAFDTSLEGGYFVYRFSDPTFIVADAVVRSVAGTVLRSGGRALDICGGSGHLTRALVPLSSPAPVLADLFFPKMWLARRFTAQGALPVCCDGNAPLPFARGAFNFAMCSDAFMFIWMKRLFIGEMFRAVQGAPNATVLINHTHNQLVWSPSHGQALTPAGYANLFEGTSVRLFGESSLFTDVVKHQALDLTGRFEPGELDGEVALTAVATTVPDVFARHTLPPQDARGCEWHINPLYVVESRGEQLQGTLRFPSADYEDEYGASRQYLPDSVTIARADLEALRAGQTPASLQDWIRRRVIVALPTGYV